MISLIALLRHYRIDRIYTSDLRRAAQTAEAIATPRGISVIPQKRLREISFGSWEGLRWADVQSLAPEYAGRWLESSFGNGAPNGERIDEFRLRATTALREIAQDVSEQMVAIVTHLGVIRTALTQLAKLDARAVWLRQIGYCSVYEFRAIEGRWVLLGVPDVAAI